MKKNNIAILLAARSGSKRLPNKHFLKITSTLKVLDLCILRLKKTKLVNKIFLCTTKKKEDDKYKKISLTTSKLIEKLKKYEKGYNKKF